MHPAGGGCSCMHPKPWAQEGVHACSCPPLPRGAECGSRLRPAPLCVGGVTHGPYSHFPRRGCSAMLPAPSKRENIQACAPPPLGEGGHSRMHPAPGESVFTRAHPTSARKIVHACAPRQRRRVFTHTALPWGGRRSPVQSATLRQGNSDATIKCCIS